MSKKTVGLILILLGIIGIIWTSYQIPPQNPELLYQFKEQINNINIWAIVFIVVGIIVYLQKSKRITEYHKS